MIEKTIKSLEFMSHLIVNDMKEINTLHNDINNI